MTNVGPCAYSSASDCWPPATLSRVTPGALLPTLSPMPAGTVPSLPSGVSARAKVGGACGAAGADGGATPRIPSESNRNGTECLMTFIENLRLLEQSPRHGRL